MENKKPEQQPKTLKIEDRPDEEIIIIEGTIFEYDFFRNFGERGFPIGSMIQIVDRPRDPKRPHVKGRVLGFRKLMSMDELQQQRRVQTPKLIIPRGN